MNSFIPKFWKAFVNYGHFFKIFWNHFADHVVYQTKEYQVS